MGGTLTIDHLNKRAVMLIEDLELDAIAAAIAAPADRIDVCRGCAYRARADCDEGCDWPEEFRREWPEVQQRFFGLIVGWSNIALATEEPAREKRGRHQPPLNGPDISDSHPTRHCGHCHACGAPLKRVLDGEEWCTSCGAYRRYRSHGWAQGAWGVEGGEMCPQPGGGPTRKQFVELLELAAAFIAKAMADGCLANTALPVSRVLKVIQTAITHSKEGSGEKPLTVRITIEGGGVQEVQTPAGVQVEVHDLDFEAAGEESVFIFPHGRVIAELESQAGGSGDAKSTDP